MTNGGTGPFRGDIILVNSGRGSLPPNVVLVNPRPPNNVTVLLNNFYGRQFNSINDVKVLPGTDILFFTDVQWVYFDPNACAQIYVDSGFQSGMASSITSAVHRSWKITFIGLTPTSVQFVP